MGFLLEKYFHNCEFVRKGFGGKKTKKVEFLVWRQSGTKKHNKRVSLKKVLVVDIVYFLRGSSFLVH